jgi:glucan endo-1,3-beta-D-glucosidase
VPNTDNARIYWEDVVCQLVKDNVNLYYYTLQDVQYGNPVPSFGLKPAGDLQAVSPLFDLSCPASSVSFLFPLLLSFTLSPLFLLLLYNLSIAESFFRYILLAVGWRCDCRCMNELHRPVHNSVWAARPTGWSAWANGHAKSSSSLLSLSATLGSSAIGIPTGTTAITSERDGEVVTS